MAAGGIITQPYLLTNPRTGRTEVIGEAGPEAVVPLRRSGSTGSTGGGNTSYVSIEKVVTDDPEALMEGVTRMADTNRNGARVKLLKALKLAEPGKF
jgi:hypothetical protein